jgi:hypothetical protein
MNACELAEGRRCEVAPEASAQLCAEQLDEPLTEELAAELEEQRLQHEAPAVTYDKAAALNLNSAPRRMKASHTAPAPFVDATLQAAASSP